MTKDNPITVTFKYSKETKRMHRYEIETDPDQYSDVLGSIYLSKPALKGAAAPRTLQVVIRPV